MQHHQYPACPDQVPPHLRGNRGFFSRWFGRTVLNLFGWRVEGTIPDVERVLIIAAPHTSNWDFVFAMAALLAINLRVRWLGKHTIFKPGVVWFMEWLGGIPVNRADPKGIVEAVVDLSKKEGGIVIGLAPEGTRKKVVKWKTGFLRLADTLDCQILLFVFDFSGKRMVIGDLYQPTGDKEADLAFIMTYYKQFIGKNPSKT
ncbi:MAG: 1-acyl-sn-glycerol-3-phosphate acyltransferase [Proteobacteria bacterium]|nr:1-acyl-sn-glycerol-3-phosphate acyltransferase [Pseudomonadota bacterium]MDA1352667.1 1-acyl-sn-glycerol-3-phosphate acyltransferase [Pseudomonadota bacterium]